MSFTQNEMEKELKAITLQLLAESGAPQKRDVRMDDSLVRHLRIDSITRAELFQRIEKKFSVALPERLLAEADTLADIAAFLKDQTPKVLRVELKTVMQLHGVGNKVDPMQAKSLVDLVLLYGQQAADKPHIYFQHEDGKEEVITYGDLLRQSLKVAANLRQLGLKEGETVAIMQPTSPLFFYTFFGVQFAGGIPVPIYPPFRPHMIEAYAKTEARILTNAEVRMLVTFEQVEKLSRLLQSFVPSLKTVITASELLAMDAAAQPVNHNVDFAFIQYTSGSTNDPKGVLLSHANLLANIRGYGSALKINESDVAVSWLPLYHDMGLIGSWLGSLYYGIPLVLMTPFSFLMHPERWLWAIHYHRGTLSGAPNFAYEMCVHKIDRVLLEGLDLSSWRVAANGAEKVYARTLQQFNERFMPFGLKPTTLTPMYGLAESTVALTIPDIESQFRVDYVDRNVFEADKVAKPSENHDGLAFVSCGKPLAHHEIRIVDDEMNVLPERHVGRLQFRGPSSMQGYYHNAEATKAVMHDGWLDSGDLGYIADGELFIGGRRKDLIIKNGRNLYPLEIEELVGQVNGIRQGCVAAFGVTDDVTRSEKLVVIAESKEKDKTRQQEIIDQAKSVVSNTLDVTVDDLVLVPQHTVPKTSSGKLQRSLCKNMYLKHTLKKSRIPASMQVVRLITQMLWNKTQNAVNKLGRFIYTMYVAIIVFVTFWPVYFTLLLVNQDQGAIICKRWLRFLLATSLCRLHVIGRENLPKTAPVIYAANHTSYLDAVVAMSLVPPGTRFVAKRELFSVPILKTFLIHLDCFPVDRGDLTRGISDTDELALILENGDSIFIFPEGTFGYAEGLRPFRMGAFKMATEAKVPICPLAFKGVRHVLREGNRLLKRGEITVTVCELVYPHGTQWTDVVAMKDQVRTEIATYCGEESLDIIAAESVAMRTR